MSDEQNIPSSENVPHKSQEDANRQISNVNRNIEGESILTDPPADRKN